LALGVAGTGKTQVLLALAEDLREQKIPVVFDCSNELKLYLSSCGINVTSDPAKSGAVHIVDDPTTLRKMKNRYITAKDSGARAFVCAIDPFQFVDRKALQKISQYVHPELKSEEYRSKSAILGLYKDVIYDATPKIYWLKSVFRQQANVGRQSLEITNNILRLNNLYIRPEKQRELKSVTEKQIQELLNDIRFVSDGGFLSLIETDSPMETLVKAMKEHELSHNNWTWTSSFLLVCDINLAQSKPTYDPKSMPLGKTRDAKVVNRMRERIGLPPLDLPVEISLPENLAIVGLMKRYNGKHVTFGQSDTVRGVEFQDVIIHMSKERFSYLETRREGLGTDEWKYIFPLHTFVTRAKRRVTIVVS
jgi:hypothetical protein